MRSSKVLLSRSGPLLEQGRARSCRNETSAHILKRQNSQSPKRHAVCELRRVASAESSPLPAYPCAFRTIVKGQCCPRLWGKQKQAMGSVARLVCEGKVGGARKPSLLARPGPKRTPSIGLTWTRHHSWLQKETDQPVSPHLKRRGGPMARCGESRITQAQLCQCGRVERPNRHVSAPWVQRQKPQPCHPPFCILAWRECTSQGPQYEAPNQTR
jgi:hypothetical protein